MLGVARSGVYRKPRPANDTDLEAMRRIDALSPLGRFFGTGRIAGTLTDPRARPHRRRIGRPSKRNRNLHSDGRRAWLRSVVDAAALLSADGGDGPARRRRAKASAHFRPAA